MKKINLIVSAAFVMLLMGCGTMKSLTETAHALKTQPKTVSISVETVPSNAKVYVDGKLVSTTTPATFSVPNQAMVWRGTQKEEARIKQDNSFDIQIVKEGYETIKDVIVPKLNGSLFSWPETLMYELKERRTDVYAKDPTIPAGAAQERVTRDTSGNTALERTIIRWYFDSAPQGARIFWRVISSVPAEVKNTNELWLGSTPFEETRAFNIQGLTYENSRDVQIEIKVKRKGYIDQSKRFNVRQAIDQQEISSFFDLVEE